MGAQVGEATRRFERVTVSIPGSDAPAVAVSRRVYDSARRPPAFVGEFRNLWEYRALFRLLVVRDVLLKYKRSVLGIWWTLLNPLLTMTVLWLVFSRIFRFAIGTTGVPYVIYLLAGVVVMVFFTQAVLAVAGSILNNADVLARVHVPPEVFSLAAATAAAVNFVLSLIPLFIFELALGVSIPWTVLLVPLFVLAVLGLAAGLGMMVASLAVRFGDTLSLTEILLQLLTYMTPVFYPISIVPGRFRLVLALNPLTHYVALFRNLVYGGNLFSSWDPVIVAGTSAVALALGGWVFARSWRAAVVML
jgi:ABC-2 type transport system permease protein